MEDKNLPLCTADMLNSMGITVNFKPLTEYISEKSYELKITHINNEEINPQNTLEILNKLNNGEKYLIKHK